jgi:hypothetical protein
MQQLSIQDAQQLLTLFQPFAESPCGVAEHNTSGGASGDGSADATAAAAVPKRPSIKIQQLAGYDDKNFGIKVAGDGSASAAYVLKVHNPNDSAAGTAGFEAQNAAMRHLAAHNVVATNAPVPLAAPCSSSSSSAVTVISRSGDGCVAVVELHGRPHAVRLLTFVPGAVAGARRQVRMKGFARIGWGCLHYTHTHCSKLTAPPCAPSRQPTPPRADAVARAAAGRRPPGRALRGRDGRL